MFNKKKSPPQASTPVVDKERKYDLTIYTTTNKTWSFNSSSLSFLQNHIKDIQAQLEDPYTSVITFKTNGSTWLINKEYFLGADIIYIDG